MVARSVLILKMCGIFDTHQTASITSMQFIYETYLFQNDEIITVEFFFR